MSENQIDSFWKIVRFPLLLGVVLLMVHSVQEFQDISFSSYGNYPRTAKGLRGILLMPFIHGSWEHLVNNSLPLLILGTILFSLYKEVAFKIYLWTFLMSGIWVWVIARPSYHIGASAIVYAFASFVFFSGIIRRNLKLMSTSLMVVFLYGSMIWGIFPIEEKISWEGHLCGAISGVILAFYFREKGLQKEIYSWDLEEEEEYEFEYWKIPEEQEQNVTTSEINASQDVDFKYVYKEKED
jgi:membrane associated rhomboid family serine protease